MLERLFGTNELVVIARGRCNEYAHGRIVGIIQGVLDFALDETGKVMSCVPIEREDDSALYIYVTGCRVTNAQCDKIKRLIGKHYPVNVETHLC